MRTALLLLDPCNDFLSEGGKVWPRLAAVAKSVALHDHLRAILAAVRRAGLPVVVVPHHRSEPDDFSGWDHPTPYQLSGTKAQVFAKGSWGGEWHPEFAPQPGDLVAKEHWTSNGFAHTDLDYLLRQRGIRELIAVGLIGNTCIEATARGAVDLGYRITLVRDATAAFSPEAMHAAHDINAPTYAHAVLTTAELLISLG